MPENEDQQLQDAISDGAPPPDVEVPDIEQADLYFEPVRTENAKPKEKKPIETVEGDKDQKIQSLESRIAEMDKSLRRLHYDERQKKKEPKDDEKPPLTDEQLLKFMEDAGDDKASLLRVIKYQAENAAKGAKNSALNEAEVTAKKNDLDKKLRDVFKDQWTDPSSQVKTEVANIKAEYGMDDHYAGDLFGVAVGVMRNLPTLQKQWFEAGKAEALKGSAEDTRQKTIEANKPGGGRKPAGGNGKGNGGLTPQQLEVAKKLGYGSGNPKKSLDRYASILRSQGTEA